MLHLVLHAHRCKHVVIFVSNFGQNVPLTEHVDKQVNALISPAVLALTRVGQRLLRRDSPLRVGVLSLVASCVGIVYRLVQRQTVEQLTVRVIFYV